MSTNYGEMWKKRIVRMPDDLWREVQKQAKLQDICAAEFVRLSLQKELGRFEDEVIYKGEVIGVCTNNARKNKKTKLSRQK